MNTTATHAAPPALLPPDDRRGTAGMYWFVLTEAMLFVSLFFAYFLLGHHQLNWPSVPPPSLRSPLVMLGLLAVSSITVEWARRQAKRHRGAQARVGIAVTVLLGAGFLVLQYFEYRERLHHLTPRSDAYGSMFYAITGLHGAHLLVGLLMLLFVAALPRLGSPTVHAPHRPLHAAAIYWHFIDVTWMVIVLLLYVLPRTHGT